MLSLGRTAEPLQSRRGHRFTRGAGPIAKAGTWPRRAAKSSRGLWRG